MELAYGAAPGDAGFSESVLTTTDSGATWTDFGHPAAVRGSSGVFATVQCVSVARCFLNLNGVILRTSTGGSSWQRIPGRLNGTIPTGGQLKTGLACTPIGGCFGFQFDASTGVPKLSWLTPGGARFVSAPMPRLPAIQNFALNSLDCPSSHRCIATGGVPSSHVQSGYGSGATFVTLNPGPNAHWVLAPLMHNRWIDEVSCATPSFCGALMEERASSTQVVQAIALSSDGGISWTPSKRISESPVPAEISCEGTLQCAAVVTPNYGDGFGDLKVSVFQTENHGRSWSDSTLTTFPDDPPLYVVGFAACLANTSCLVDATEFPPPRVRRGSLQPAGLLESSTGSALSQVLVSNSPLQATGITCTESSTCWRVDRMLSSSGYAAALEVSSDDGASWSTVLLPSGVAPVLVGGCQSATSCEILGVSGVSLYGGQLGNFDYTGDTIVELTTSDGGTSWSEHTIPGSNQMPEDASCTSSTSCVVLMDDPPGTGAASALDSTSNGATWTSYSVPWAPIGPDQLPETALGGWGLGCASTGECLFAEPTAAGGVLLWASTDGGSTWSRATPPAGTVAIGGVYCARTGVCVIDTEIKAVPNAAPTFELNTTADGAATWSAHLFPNSGVLDAVPELACADILTCTFIASGLDQPAIALSTSDGGGTWFPVSWGATIPPQPVDGMQAVGLLSCSATACLAEVKGIDSAGPGASAFQILRRS